MYIAADIFIKLHINPKLIQCSSKVNFIMPELLYMFTSIYGIEMTHLPVIAYSEKRIILPS